MDALCCMMPYDVGRLSWKRSRRGSQIVDFTSCVSLMEMILGKFLSVLTSYGTLFILDPVAVSCKRMTNIMSNNDFKMFLHELTSLSQLFP